MAPSDGTLTVLGRGLRRRCPRCGEGALFDGFFTQRPRCTACGLDLADRHGDSFGFFYLTTGAITGMGIIALLLIRPHNLVLGRAILLGIVALIYGGTIPQRRGLALAASYLMKRISGDA